MNSELLDMYWIGYRIHPGCLALFGFIRHIEYKSNEKRFV